LSSGCFWISTVLADRLSEFALQNLGMQKPVAWVSFIQ